MIKQFLKAGFLFFTFLFVTGLCAYLTLTYFIKNEESVVVPELVGKDVVSVLEHLTELGLNTKVKGSEYTSEIPKNHVISQDPEPGTMIKKGRDVRIIFSKGASTTTMPSLRFLPVQEAGIVLGEAGLRQGVLSYTHNGTVPKNNVIAQFPDGGGRVHRGIPVDILVSKGKRPEEYLMSDLTGMSIDDAILFIEKSNLKLGEIKSRYLKGVPRNVVTAHEPSTGYKVVEGSVVNLVINRPTDSGKKRIFQADSGPRLFRYKVAHGFLKKHIRAQMSSYGSINEVFNDFVKPGEEVWVMVPVNTEATLFLYEDNTLIKTQFFD